MSTLNALRGFGGKSLAAAQRGNTVDRQISTMVAKRPILFSLRCAGGLWLEAGRTSTSKLAAQNKCRPPGHGMSKAQIHASWLFLIFSDAHESPLYLQVSVCPGGGLQTSWQKVSFQHQFPVKPAFLTMIQTVNNEVGLPAADSTPWFTVT